MNRLKKMNRYKQSYIFIDINRLRKVEMNRLPDGVSSILTDLELKDRDSRYHTITDVYTTALLLTKPSSDDDSGFRHGFGAEASLPLAQSAPAVSHDTTKLYQIVVALWDCQIHADAVRALSWIFSMYFLLSDGGSPRLVKKTEVELAIKPLHPTLIGNTFVIQPFLNTLFSQIFIFFQLTLMCPVEIFFIRDCNFNNENSFCFNGPKMTISIL